MQRYHRVIVAGLVVLVGGCAPRLASSDPSAPAEAIVAAESPAQLTVPLASSPLPAVAVAGRSPQPRLAPELIPATVPSQRLPGVAAGRPDPFAAVGSTPIVTPIDRPASPVAAVPPVPVLPDSPAAVPASPSAPATVPEPPLLPALDPAAANPLSPPSSPSLASLPLAQAIEVSGVVQTGSQTSAIVWVPQESSSRYVHEGEYLANGRIRVKRIVVGSSTEPVVILEQDGVEVVRTVGSGGARVGLL